MGRLTQNNYYDQPKVSIVVIVVIVEWDPYPLAGPYPLAAGTSNISISHTPVYESVLCICLYFSVLCAVPTLCLNSYSLHQIQNALSFLHLLEGK